VTMGRLGVPPFVVCCMEAKRSHRSIRCWVCMRANAGVAICVTEASGLMCVQALSCSGVDAYDDNSSNDHRIAGSCLKCVGAVMTPDT